MSSAAGSSGSLRAQASRFDDEALAHLANRGLVRRARKLLESAPVEIDESDRDELCVESDGWSVRFSSGLPVTDGRCACPTAGVCQHLIAAIVALRDTSPVGADVDVREPPGDDPPSDGIAAPRPDASSSGDAIRHWVRGLSDAEVVEYAKKRDLAWALSRAADLDPSSIVVERGSNLHVALPPPHPSVRFFGTGFEHAVVKPSTSNDRRAITLAVLALRAADGRQLPVVDEADRRRDPLVNERRAVLGRVATVCERLLTIGLLHAGDGERERLDALAASARGVKLYRVAVIAERAADQVVAISGLSVEADSGRLLEHLSELSTVAEATDRELAAGRIPSERLVGTARTAYVDVGQLELVGLGHYSWGDHRFAGTSAVLAETAGRVFTLARPTRVAGRALDGSAGWSGVGAVTSLSGRHVALSGGQANEAMRLSGRAATRATLGRVIEACDLDVLAWDGVPPGRSSRLHGASAPCWRVLPVDAGESAAEFDAVDQRFRWTIRSAGSIVQIELPQRASTAAMIATLEQLLARGQPSHVAARLDAERSRLTAWPVSAWADGALVNLADPAATLHGDVRRAARRFGRRSTAPVATSIDPDAAPVADAPGAIDQLRTRLLHVAERGRSQNGDDELASLGRTAESWGFAVVADVIDRAPNWTAAALRAAWVLGSATGDETRVRSETH